MVILGIGDSHEAHACVVVDGKLTAAIAEERLSRLKADMGYPKRSIDAVLSLSGLEPDEIDIVAIASRKMTPFQTLYKMNAVFKTKDWIRQCEEYWGPILLEGKNLTPWHDFELFSPLRGAALKEDPYFVFLERAKSAPPEEYHNIFNELRAETVQKHLGVDRSKIHFYRHEDCHKMYGVCSSPSRLTDALVLTAEGGGDDSSATFSTWRGGELTERWASNAVNLGRLYRYVTLILGMQPSQHEYKVMGLAPYGTEYHGHRSRDFFNTLSKVEGSQIVSTGLVKDLYYSVKDALEGERFDGVAWGLQEHLEEVLRAWVENCIKETGLTDVVFSGGIGQNIKACKNLVDQTSLTSLWSGPICGDGSLGIGAAWMASREFAPDVEIDGYSTIYLGTEYGSKTIEDAINRNQLASEFQVIESPGSEQIADWLSNGAICARFSGRMEFGQRALGARSILADPRRWESVERVNNKIKYRDFWMPFTPSMTKEQADAMIENPKNVYSPYMTVAFDLKSNWVGRIPAATHPADKTVRPQMLRREDNEGYYDLLKSFGRVAGMEVLMNTSFNLHGDAIVESPDDAIETFKKSELDVLLFDDVAISRQPKLTSRIQQT
ncbi:MAG: carbamoyltransferase C-terminal domain-containing protein [Rhizobiaceae bacterium]